MWDINFSFINHCEQNLCYPFVLEPANSICGLSLKLKNHLSFADDIDYPIRCDISVFVGAFNFNSPIWVVLSH